MTGKYWHESGTSKGCRSESTTLAQLQVENFTYFRKIYHLLRQAGFLTMFSPLNQLVIKCILHISEKTQKVQVPGLDPHSHPSAWTARCSLTELPMPILLSTSIYYTEKLYFK